MPRLAANLTLLFSDLPFLERLDAAAAAGFKGVEWMFSYDTPAEQVRERLNRLGLTPVLINLPAGDWAGGDRGLAGIPERIDEQRAALDRAIAYARVIGCCKLHAMAGVVPAGADRARHLDAFVSNLREAADAAAGDGIDVMVEPLNRTVDVPGYLIAGSGEGMEVIERVDRPNVRLQYDVYHMQIVEGDLARTIERLLPHIGHIQIADNPGRNEPGTGEINYPWLFDRIEALGYDGWIGCEYRPKGATLDGLGWATRYLGGQA